uniref:Zinc finger, CCHC-type n=1 Tax=Tanacetum cinerariifolium TaxID=118510 RepID=A0A6L2K9R8_TANCI|nr:zinc finger, CCHC-type [Tanacetum cinerariifolium]
MVVKTAFLNGELDEEAHKQWHQKFNEVLLSNGYLLNQTDKCVYSKFDACGQGVIICLYVDDMLIFSTDKVQVDLTKKFLSLKFSKKDRREADVIFVSTPMDTSEKLMPNNGQAVSQLKYSRVISCMIRIHDASWINNIEDNSSTSGGVFLLDGGAISWASKKQTCITSLTMECEFVALATADKEVEWLRNMIA